LTRIPGIVRNAIRVIARMTLLSLEK